MVVDPVKVALNVTDPVVVVQVTLVVTFPGVPKTTLITLIVEVILTSLFVIAFPADAVTDK